MASTVLPNGIIIPEKYSRDWYADLYHNWQELDNLLGGGTPKDGTLTIQKNGSTVGTFSANQATNETVNIEVPTKTSDLTNDSNFVESSDLATVATSGSYNDLSNKPTIPTVNNATLTIQKNGTTVKTFTANQSTNATANITVPTKTSDLTNDSGFITADDTKIPLAGSSQISGSLIPATTDTVNLGSPSYQWNNLYAKNYYYNGVAWGLNQANVWTGRQTYGAYLKIFGETRTDEWSSNSRTNAYLLSRRDTDDVSGFLINTFRSNTEQGTAAHIYGWDILENSTRYSGLRFAIGWDPALNSGSGAYRVTLGTNTQGTNPCNDLHITQLKKINGINPGALSLPDNSKSVVIDTTNWDVAGGTNVYTPPANGWLHIRVTDATELAVRWTDWRFGDRRVSATATDLDVTIPVVAGVTIDVITVASSFNSKCQFFPCRGNI